MKSIKDTEISRKGSAFSLPKDVKALRNAIVLKEILDKPKGLQR